MQGSARLPAVALAGRVAYHKRHNRRLGDEIHSQGNHLLKPEMQGPGEKHYFPTASHHAEQQHPNINKAGKFQEELWFPAPPCLHWVILTPCPAPTHTAQHSAGMSGLEGSVGPGSQLLALCRTEGCSEQGMFLSPHEWKWVLTWEGTPEAAG